MNVRRMLATVIASLCIAAPTIAAPAKPHLADITSSGLGSDLANQGAARLTADGFATDASSVRVWELASGEYLVATELPPNFATKTSQTADGYTRTEITFDTTKAQISASNAGQFTTLSASWAWVTQYCFARMSNLWGWLDTCYVIHKLVGESDGSYDYYQLEQYGTVAAGGFPFYGKIYGAFVEGQKAGSSSTMAWIDWNPRSNTSGNCRTLNLNVSALGVGISGVATACEQWIPTKWAAAGHFKLQWSCGCIVPFGQPYPNSREVDYMQAVRVPQNGRAVWTLSAGFDAFQY